MSRAVLESESVTVLPGDEYNPTLTGNVHPPGWINPEPAGRYNLVVQNVCSLVPDRL